MIVGRRSFLFSLLGILSGVTASRSNPSNCDITVDVGAIRWDAWYAPSDAVNKNMVRDLSVPSFRSRLPFFSKIDEADKVMIDGGHQDIIDLEISQAIRAGLSYWAFVGYEPGSAMDTALRLYLSSAKKRSLQFCLISEMSRWGLPGQSSAMIDRHIDLLSHPNYFSVSNGRPLYFVGFFDEPRFSSRWNGVNGFREAIKEFKAESIRRANKLPYIVIMDWTAKRAAQLCSALGADAISCYAHAVQNSSKSFKYSDLSNVAESYWDVEAATGLPIVPTAMAGWNDSPRPTRPPDAQPLFFDSPSTGQLGEHISKCVNWIRSNPRACPTRSALVYAWNENTEGGWLIPTLGEGDRRISELEEVSRGRYCKTKP